MGTTVSAIIDAAFAKSAASRPETIAVEEGELIEEVGRQLRDAFAFAALVNPNFFGTIDNVPFSTEGGLSGWKRPSDAQSVFFVAPTGDTKDEAAVLIVVPEISVVPFDDRALEAGSPAVFEFGQFFLRAGNAGDPQSGSVAIYYSRKPTVPTAIGQTLDSQWPEDMNPILINGLAAYLAEKDDRDADVQRFNGRQAAWQQTFEQFLRNTTISTRQRFESFRPISRTAVRAETGE